jgi:hypothetical protein
MTHDGLWINPGKNQDRTFASKHKSLSTSASHNIVDSLAESLRRRRGPLEIVSWGHNVLAFCQQSFGTILISTTIDKDLRGLHWQMSFRLINWLMKALRNMKMFPNMGIVWIYYCFESDFLSLSSCRSYFVPDKNAIAYFISDKESKANSELPGHREKEQPIQGCGNTNAR